MTRAVASQNVTTLKEEDKVKLGRSGVKVSRLGTGAWETPAIGITLDGIVIFFH